MVAMETSSHVDSHLSFQIVPRWFLEKVAKFGTICFNIKKLLTSKVAAGRIPPLPSLNRVKHEMLWKFESSKNLKDMYGWVASLATQPHKFFKIFQT